MIRVVIVDDSPDFLDSAARFLAADPGIAVVGRAGSGAEALSVVEALRPDLVLVDLSMPDMSGLDVTRHLRARSTPPRIVVVSLDESAEHRRAAEAAGADGCVGKREFADVIIPAIRALRSEGTPEGDRPVARPPSAAPSADAILTPEEAGRVTSCYRPTGRRFGCRAAEVVGRTIRPPSGPPEAPARRRVLVVDDESVVAEMLADAIAASGHDVETAPNGAEALRRLQHAHFDLVLVDLRMPEVDGRELYRELERTRPAMCRRLVFMTGDALAAETTDFLGRTNAPVLPKPFTLTELRRTLEAAWAERGAT
jgi:CheY-like chemotaxis protein